jgi:serine protease DegS
MLNLVKNNFLFVGQSAIVGLLAALLLHYFYLQPQQADADRQVTLLGSNNSGYASTDGRQPFSYRDAVKRAAPSVVNIYTATRHNVDRSKVLPLFDKLFGDETGSRVETSVGSGVIVSPEGYIITNNHVISNAGEIWVILTDGGSFRANLIGSDVETDLAVLRISASAPLPAITLADKQSISVGDVVLAIGNPFGVGQTVTQGIVSATGRNRLGLNTFEEFIQTDAAINPGNSGGALINPHGELVGINTAIFTNSEGAQGISFAIPISLVQNVMLQILEHGKVTPGWLGVQAYDITSTMRQRFGLSGPGVLVTGVFRDSPADMAGIVAGDILTYIDDESLLDTQILLNATRKRPPGTRIKINGVRNGREYSLMATLMQRPKSQ